MSGVHHLKDAYLGYVPIQANIASRLCCCQLHFCWTLEQQRLTGTGRHHGRGYFTHRLDRAPVTAPMAFCVFEAGVNMFVCAGRSYLGVSYAPSSGHMRNCNFLQLCIGCAGQTWRMHLDFTPLYITATLFYMFFFSRLHQQSQYLT